LARLRLAGVSSRSEAGRADIARAGGYSLAVACEVAHAGAVEAAAARAGAELAPIEMWVNNAMALAYRSIPLQSASIYWASQHRRREI
jgi:NAD(P)-dependent dehydrogenase (short-subunit alcohol dehydrogenase family)